MVMEMPWQVTTRPRMASWCDMRTRPTSQRLGKQAFASAPSVSGFGGPKGYQWSDGSNSDFLENHSGECHFAREARVLSARQDFPREPLGHSTITERGSAQGASVRRAAREAKGGQAPRTLDASAVPSTRARIFAKAVSREVETSSANGEKPQSSVVPRCDGLM